MAAPFAEVNIVYKIMQ